MGGKVVNESIGRKRYDRVGMSDRIGWRKIGYPVCSQAIELGHETRAGVPITFAHSRSPPTNQWSGTAYIPPQPPPRAS